MPNFVKHTVVVTAVAAALAAGTANAQSYVIAGGQPLRASDGQCWRTSYRTAQQADKDCDPQIVATIASRKAVTYSTEVLFAFDDDTLSLDARKQLDDLARRLLEVDLDKLVAVGHADGLGSPQYNKRLSARRAKAVGDYLAGKGVSSERLRLVALGEQDPVTAGACDAMALEKTSGPKLIACLQPDRRVKVGLVGRQKAD